jgi:outer membrane protein TolC
MKHTIQALTWALLIGHGLTANAQAPLQREEAVALALEQNLGVQIARLNVEQAEVNDAWGAAGALPQIGLNTNLSGAVSDQSENPTSFIQERLESQSVSIGGQLNWVVFDGLGMFANKRALETLVEQADGQARLIIEQTIAATLQAYDAVLVQQEVLATLDATVDAAEARLDWMAQRVAFGAAAEFDRLQVESGLLSDRLSRMQQALAVEVAFRALNQLMGQPLNTQWVLSELEPPSMRDFNGLQALVLSDGTTMENARIAESLARTGLQQAQARMSPTIALTASQGDQRSQFAAGELSGDGRTKNIAASLVLNFNLFNGGATRRGIQQAKLQVLAAERSLANQEQEVLRIFADTRQRWQTEADSYALAVQLKDNATASAAIAEQRFKSGAMNSLDFREVELQRLRAEQSALQALQAWLAADVELDRLAGTWVKPME